MIYSWRREGGFGGVDLECSGFVVKWGYGSGGVVKYMLWLKMVEVFVSIVDDVFV